MSHSTLTFSLPLRTTSTSPGACKTPPPCAERRSESAPGSTSNEPATDLAAAPSVPSLPAAPTVVAAEVACVNVSAATQTAADRPLAAATPATKRKRDEEEEDEPSKRAKPTPPAPTRPTRRRQRPPFPHYLQNIDWAGMWRQEYYRSIEREIEDELFREGILRGVEEYRRDVAVGKRGHMSFAECFGEEFA